MDIGSGHGHVSGAGQHHGMAEADDALAVHVGQGADAGGAQVAGDQLHPQGGPRLEAHWDLGWSFAPGSGHGVQAQRAQQVLQDLAGRRGEAGDPHGCAQRLQGDRAGRLPVADDVLESGRALQVHGGRGPDLAAFRRRLQVPIHDRDHLVDGCDAADRYLGVRPSIGHGADQTAVDVDRAAAHALDDSGLFQRSAGQPGQDQVLARPQSVALNSEDFDLEGVDGGSLEDGLAHAAHAAAKVIRSHERGRSCLEEGGVK